jgi:serine O-acetyltransferase
MLGDFKRYSSTRTGLSGFLIAVCHPMFWAISIYRIAHIAFKLKLYPISKLLQIVNFFLFKVEINFRSNINKGFKINHGFGVVIGGGATLGENVTVFQGVTIGGNMGKTRNIEEKIITQPIIKDGVMVGPYAQIYGPVIIGENSQIAAHTIVTKDIPPNTLVYGNPNILREKPIHKNKVRKISY